MIKNLRSLILCFFLVVPMLSCDEPASRPPGNQIKNENILRFDVAAPFTSLNPAEVEGSGSTIIFPLLYSFLCVPNENGTLCPDLATSWNYAPVTFTWTIHLKTGARFHNNRPVTSADAVYSINTILRNIRPALIASVKKISIITDSVFCIYLNRNDPAFIQKIWDVEIIPEADKNNIDYYNHPIGSGPFKFDFRNKDKKVVLAANDLYYNGRPSLDGVIFYYQPDKEKAWTRLLAGTTDIAQEISPKNFEIMKQYENRFYFDQYILKFYSILLYNTNDPLFSDLLVRQALTHAIDRDYIVKKILNSYAKIAIGPMGVDSPFHNPALTPLSFDPKKSVELLRQAGWTNKNNSPYLYKNNRIFEFTLQVLKESQVEKNIAQYIKLCFNDIGIKMRIQSLSMDNFYQTYYQNNAFHAVLTEFTGVYKNPEILYEFWTPHLLEKSRAGGFCHPQVTDLIRKAAQEKNPKKQKQIFYHIDALISSLCPGTFLFHKTAIDVMSRRFTLPYSFALSHPGIYRLRYVNLAQN